MADAEGADDDEGDGAGDTIEDLFAAVEHGRIDDVCAVRRTDDEDVFSSVDTIHLSEHLIHHALGRISAIGRPLRNEGVQLVEEYHTRRRRRSSEENRPHGFL